MVMVIRTVPR